MTTSFLEPSRSPVELPSTVPFAAGLAEHGGRVALVEGDRRVSYRELALLVEHRVEQLGAGRRLVMLGGANTIDAVVTYLAALAGGHPVMLAPPGEARRTHPMAGQYRPDVVAGPATGWQPQDRHPGSGHDLHRDLALLLSTSGSTGSPKLVRLSQHNVQANAAAIAEYLQIRPDDRAITTLPMHYCYGLSVLNSHLLMGAGVVLTDRSVVDERFWSAVRRERVTTIAGVPYTFELLDRVGFAQMDLPDLRHVTQAGGRLEPDLVRRYARLGTSRGWQFFVMYGQTEATARMGYLPPELAESHPHCIGIPVPGGEFDLEPLPGDDGAWAGAGADDQTAAAPAVGELVYRGPNVMMGYATCPADLAAGTMVDRLRTGDVARRTADGLYEVIGRRSRFAKLFGLRVDLDGVEAHLAADRGLRVSCADAGTRLVLAVEGGSEPADVEQEVASFCGLPVRAVKAIAVPRLPRLGNGKPDHAAVRALAATGDRPAAPPADRPAPPAAGQPQLLALFAEVLGSPHVTPDDSFVALGGDSLNYVELSVRLEEALGHLPPGWQTMPIRDLGGNSPSRPRWGRTVETSVLLRAVAIVLVAGSHIEVFDVLGGAHLLLAVAGFNLARFSLTGDGRRRRLRQGLRALAWMALPSMAFIGIAAAVTGQYDARDVLLLNGLVGSGQGQPFWFIEVLAYLTAAVTALCAVPVVHAAERRWPFAVPVVLALVGLLPRYGLVAGQAPPGERIYAASMVFWLFAVGWAAARAGTVSRRLVVTALTAATVPGFFEDLSREGLVVTGVAVLVWLPVVRIPALAVRTVTTVAASSLCIYLVHWHVYPFVQAHSRLGALVASLAVGVLLARLVTWVRTRSGAVLRPVPA